VAVSVVALLMASDENGLMRQARRSQEIRTVKWDWGGKLARVEKYLESARESLTKGGENSHESADKQIQSLRNELETWLKAAEPRFQETIAELSKKADELRGALRERSEQASGKLNDLGESLRAFRDKLGLKKSPAPAEQGSKK